MAKGKKTGGRNFKPGQSGNPKGPATIPADIKAARELSKIEFERIANKYLFMTKNEITAAAMNAETPALELLVGSIVHKAVVEGDERRLNFLLDRLIGKVAERIGGPDGKPLPAGQTVVLLPRNGREANG